MKFAIMESIMTPGGHEVDFDRIIVDELRALGHQAEMYVPENMALKLDYGVPIRYLEGQGISYEGLSGIGKIIAAVKREWNRQRWFKGMFEYARQGAFDAIVIPTSTYRYLRALNINKLKKSPVPVMLIVHGVNPREVGRLFKEASNLEGFPNIKLVVLTFGEDVLGYTAPNVFCINPPTYIPRDITCGTDSKKGGVVKLGFFGQYRREKNLEGFLETFLSCQFTYPVEIFVQGATVHPEDAAEFERIMHKYKGVESLKFLHKGLIGRQWQEAIAGVDALLMPYGSNRYLYHWGGMLFTAIGYLKPVIAASTINPEVFQKFDIGVTFDSGNKEQLREALEKFVNTYPDKVETYERDLKKAAEEYSPKRFAQALSDIAKNKSSH